jgi:hypothetical protein
VCSICVFFLTKEGANCSLTPNIYTPNIYTPVRTEFEQGLGQKFRQDPGTGVMLALFEDRELLKGGEDNVFPLVFPSITRRCHEKSCRNGETSRVMYKGVVDVCG